MSRLEELIAELCPDGVEYSVLSRVCDIYDGTHQTPEYTNSGIKFVSVENISDLFGTKKYISEVDYNSKYKVKPQRNDVLMTRIGSVGICAVVESDEPLAYYVSLALLRPSSQLLNSRFLKYTIESMHGRKELYKRTLVNAVPIKVNMGDIGKITIPLPPLPVQQEIVRILDQFTMLEAELDAELEVRKKQYENYRENLLAFSQNVNRYTVGDVCDVITDYVAAGSFAELARKVIYQSNPDYAQLVRTTDVKSNFTKGDYVYISKEAFEFLWRVNLDKESIILPNIGVNCGEVYYLKPDKLPYKYNVLGPNAIMVRSNKNNNKFLSYIFKSREFQGQLRRIITPAGQTKFNKTELKKILIPVPPPKEQERIVAILDCFDTLVNDNIQGLPAEITARRKQYEYYRDKLLTFKEKVS